MVYVNNSMIASNTNYVYKSYIYFINAINLCTFGQCLLEMFELQLQSEYIVIKYIQANLLNDNVINDVPYKVFVINVNDSQH